jgi:HK97 family phage portal protein
MPNAFQRFVQRVVGITTPSTKAPLNNGGYLPLSGMAGFGGMEPPNPQSNQFVGEYRSWVYACVTTIADEVAKIKLALYRRKPNGEIEKVLKHEVLDLLHRVNTNLTYFELWNLTSTHNDIYGEAFWWLVKDKNKIIGIYPWLIPGNLDVTVDNSGQVSGYKYRVPGKNDVILFTVDEILHFKSFNPASPYRGMSPISAASFAIATDREAAAWNWRWFKNNAKPGGYISYPGNLSEAQKEQLKVQWNNEHRGSENNSRIALLEGGMTFNEAGLSQKDMDFLESRNYNRDEIFTIYKVPRALINPDASITRANAEVVNLYFFERTIEPRMMKFVAVLNEFLLPQYDPTGALFFDYENTGPRDLEADLRYYESGLNNGWLTPNAVRKFEGEEPYEGGDEFTRPFNLVGVGKEPETKIVGVNIAKLHTTGKPSVAETIYDDALKLAQKTAITTKHRTAADVTKQSVVQKQAVEASQSDKEARIQIGEGMVQMKKVRIDQELKVYDKTLKKQFERQRDEVLKTVSEKSVKGKKGAKLKAVSFDFDDEAEGKLFAEIFLPITREVVKAHGEDALKLLGESGFDVNRGVQEFIKRKGLEFCKDINATTKTRIQSAINAGIDEGEGIESIRRRINGVFDDATTYRARMIAQTEVNRASNFGIQEGYAQSEVVEEKEWYTPLDEDDDVCVPMNGTTVKLNEDFTLPDGDTVNAPPAHPNCHCTTLPVLGKSKDGEAPKKALQPFLPVIIEVPVIDQDAVEKMEKVTEEGERAVAGLKELHQKLSEDGDEQI